MAHDSFWSRRALSVQDRFLGDTSLALKRLETGDSGPGPIAFGRATHVPGRLATTQAESPSLYRKGLLGWLNARAKGIFVFASSE